MNFDHGLEFFPFPLNDVYVSYIIHSEGVWGINVLYIRKISAGLMFCTFGSRRSCLNRPYPVERSGVLIDL